MPAKIDDAEAKVLGEQLSVETGKANIELSKVAGLVPFGGQYDNLNL